MPEPTLPVAPVAPAPAPAPAAPTPPPVSPFPAATPPADTGPDPVLEGDAPFLAAIAKVDGPAPAPKPATPATPKAPVTPKPAPKPGEKPGAQGAAPELRKQYETLRSEHEVLKSRIPELEAKIANWEARGKDTEGLQAKLAGLEKERESLKSDLFAYRQTDSPDFVAKYEKPFDQAAEYAKQEITQLEYTQDDGTTRPATWQDFANIYRNMPAARALDEIKERFGAGAIIATDHHRALSRLARERDAAASDLRANAIARMKDHETQQATMSEQRRGLLTRVGKELSERVPEYHDDPTDAEGAAARNKGYEIYDAEPKTPRESVLKESHVRHRFAAYNPLRLKVMKLERELAELKAGAPKVDPDADPGRTRRGGGGAGTGVDTRTWEEQAMEDLKNVQ